MMLQHAERINIQNKAKFVFHNIISSLGEHSVIIDYVCIRQKDVGDYGRRLFSMGLFA